MPCYSPITGYHTPSGIKFGRNPNSQPEIKLSCSRCIGCKLEQSRQWAVRLMHEAQMHEVNCFLTLTFNDESLQKMCPDGSLNKRHMQLFMKRLRKKFPKRVIRYYYCGEYGENFSRPHYHLILFNLDFPDKKLFKQHNDTKYYTSDILADIWPYGFNIIGEVTFESASYVARYVTKKINGDNSESHYKGKAKEFGQASLKPGIGHSWIEKYGSTDVFPYDEVVVRNHKTKPPRYYDKYLEKTDPETFRITKANREFKALQRKDDNTPERLEVKERKKLLDIKKLHKKFEGKNTSDFFNLNKKSIDESFQKEWEAFDLYLQT